MAQTEDSVARSIFLDVPSGTIDPNEVERFSANATQGGRAARARNWLVKYNPVRLAFVAKALQTGVAEDGLSGLRVLDVGCGTGLFCELLAQHGAKVKGIDPARGAIEVARAKADAKGLAIEYATGTLEEVTETFDLVTAMEVIEHVADAAEFLQHCAARVSPGGRLVLSTIDRSLKSFMYAKVMGEYILRMLPIGAHQWARFLHPAEIQAELSKLNFGDFIVSGVTLNLRSGHLQLSRDSSVNYMLAARHRDRESSRRE